MDAFHFLERAYLWIPCIYRLIIMLREFDWKQEEGALNMDELAGLIGGLVAVVAVIYAIAWLIAIVVTAAIFITVIAGPPLGLGTLLKRLLTKRYSLSRRKKWQCAGLTALSSALPFLALVADSSVQSGLAATWAGTVLGMSSLSSFLAISAYQQHFAQHRRSISEARTTLMGERIRHTIASVKLWRMNKTLNHVERKHGHLLRAQDDLTARMDALIEKNDPALLRIKLNQWEQQYSALPPKQIVAQLDSVTKQLGETPESHQATALLQSHFLEALVIRRKLAGSETAARFHELRATRDELNAVVAGCTETINACMRVQSEKTAKIAQLKNQRLVIQ